jgi:hypothetical protein
MSAMRIGGLFLACVLILGTACAKRIAACRVSCKGITGSVICSVSDYWSGDPLVGAPIGVDGTDSVCRTDLNGRCRIVLPPGQYTLTASYKGYMRSHVQVAVDPERETQADFHLRSYVRIERIIRNDEVRH